MTKKILLFLLPVLLILGNTRIKPVSAQDVPQFKTVWDGVYTTAQAGRGKEWADTYCIECHGETLTGASAPPLRGDRFMAFWHGGALDNIYDYIRVSMPAERPKGDLNDQSYLDILAYILQSNGMPTGNEELTRAPLWTIMLQGSDGPKPLASQSPVLTVGCITPNADNTWSLTKATDPIRNKKLDETNPLELKAYGSRPAGTNTFRLPNAAAFKAESHNGQRVLAKGVLGKQAAGDRINLTLLEPTGAACGQ